MHQSDASKVEMPVSLKEQHYLPYKCIKVKHLAHQTCCSLYFILKILMAFPEMYLVCVCIYIYIYIYIYMYRWAR